MGTWRDAGSGRAWGQRLDVGVHNLTRGAQLLDVVRVDVVAHGREVGFQRRKLSQKQLMRGLSVGGECGCVKCGQPQIGGGELRKEYLEGLLELGAIFRLDEAVRFGVFESRPDFLGHFEDGLEFGFGISRQLRQDAMSQPL